MVFVSSRNRENGKCFRSIRESPSVSHTEFGHHAFEGVLEIDVLLIGHTQHKPQDIRQFIGNIAIRLGCFFLFGTELMVVLPGEFTHFFREACQQAHLVPVPTVALNPRVDGGLEGVNSGIGHDVLLSHRVSPCALGGASLPMVSMEVAVAADDLIDMEGTIAEVFPGGTFLVETEHGNKVQAHLAGKLRRYRIRVVLLQYFQ